MTFGKLVDEFFRHYQARARAWGVEPDPIERELVAGALAGMLNDGVFRVGVYEVHEEVPKSRPPLHVA